MEQATRPEPVRSPRRGLAERLRRGTFGVRPDRAARRRASDVVRLVVAAGLLVVAIRHVGSVTDTERAIFDLFNSLPDGLGPLFRSFYRVGALWTVGLVVVTALIGRRWRLARDLLLAGFLAWAVGRIMGEMVVAGASLAKSFGAVTRSGPHPDFPAVRIAVLVAVISAARPSVTRPIRRIGHVLVAGVVVAAMYLGNALPNAVFAGLVLGWGIGTLLHLVFGSPGGRPTVVDVERSLRELGVVARGLRRATHQPTGSTLMYAEDDQGTLRIKVIGRDEADAQFLAKLYRFLVYKEFGARLSLTRLQQIEHEAYVMLLARTAGVRVPRVVVAGKGGPGAALLVQRAIEGTPLAGAETDAVDDELLTSMWRQLLALHDAHVVHERLDADHVILTPDGPALVGFGGAGVSGFPEPAAADIAELLVTTSIVAGDERAIAAAVAEVPRDEFVGALAFLQPAALTSRTRELAGPGRRALRDRLERLRAHGAAACGTEPPEVVQLQRIAASSLAMAVGTLVAAGVLLAEVGDPTLVWNAFRHAEWQWVGIAIVLSFASNIGFAIALQGTVPVRLPLWRTTELQVAMSFTNLAIPGVGGLAMQIRYLQKQGVDLSSAVAAGGFLSTIGNLVAALGLFGIAIAVDPSKVDLGLVPTTGLAELAAGALALGFLVAALVIGIPKLRRVVLPPIGRAAATLWTALRSPRLVAALVGGNVAALLLAVYTMQACLVAFDGHTSFWGVLAAYIGINTIAAIVPIPGGSTAVSSVGLSGALVAFGVPEEVAITAVLINQIVYNYLPALPGWFATRDLMRHDYL